MRAQTGETAADMPTYAKTTWGVAIEVEPIFLESQSFPAMDHYVWAYKVRIMNQRGDTVQLKTRHWRITDSDGGVREVNGEGVVGEQPVIQPGAMYEYMSGAPLTTPSGVMGGRYGMVTGAGESLDVEIPTFSLDSPHERRMLN